MRYVPKLLLGIALSCASIVAACGNSFSGGEDPGATDPDASVDSVEASTGGPKPLGESCTEGGDCSSGFCADGVCCENACDGVCEACNRLGAVGRCVPVPANQDPDKECTTRTPPKELDGGAGGDGGDAGTVINLPEEELTRDQTACAGACNGERACSYPDDKTTCGSSYCNSESEVGRASCDGNGRCSGIAIEACSAYTCSTSGASPECGTSCASEADCQSTHYCSGQNRCEPKKSNGTGCGLSTECASGHCVGSGASAVCCNSACSGDGFSCTSTGNVGNCVCPACPTGACQLYYRDADGDGFGDKSGTVANGKAAYGCKDGPPPAGFVSDNTDCYDENNAVGPKVRPDQQEYFETAYGPTNSFDYNCDGREAPLRPMRPGETCKFCSTGAGTCSRPATCSSAGQQAAHGCVYGINPANGLPSCTAYPVGAFRQAVACGKSAPYYTCGKCSAAGQHPSLDTSKTETQRCR